MGRDLGKGKRESGGSPSCKRKSRSFGAESFDGAQDPIGSAQGLSSVERLEPVEAAVIAGSGSSKVESLNRLGEAPYEPICF